MLLYHDCSWVCSTLWVRFNKSVVVDYRTHVDGKLKFVIIAIFSVIGLSTWSFCCSHGLEKYIIAEITLN